MDKDPEHKTQQAPLVLSGILAGASSKGGTA